MLFCDALVIEVVECAVTEKLEVKGLAQTAALFQCKHLQRRFFQIVGVVHAAGRFGNLAVPGIDQLFEVFDAFHRVDFLD